MRSYAVILFLCLFVFFFSGVTLSGQPRVGQDLIALLSEKQDDEFISINIVLKAQYDQHLLENKSSYYASRSKQREYVVGELKAFSLQQQQELLGYLDLKQTAGMVREIRPYWITNMVNCKAKPAVIAELMSRKDLSLISHNKKEFLETQFTPGAEAIMMEADKLSTPDLAWNVARLNADKVWDLGYTGEGVVVAVIDSGVNYLHRDIRDNMWEHPDFPNHGYNFWDDNHDTMDFSSHGAHVAGTVAGTGLSGTATGVAPGARIMALRVMSATGTFDGSTVLSAIQFAVEYGAHIMNLSLGIRNLEPEQEGVWRTTMNNVLHAGVIAVVAAGNSGSSAERTVPRNIQIFGSIPPPWLHPDQEVRGGTSSVICVGAVTDTDSITGFSSRGPVTWQEATPYYDYPYDPGPGLIRPDVVAPGFQITSLLHNSETGYALKNGTSMASPAVAGVLALMLSRNPALTPRELGQRLETTSRALSEVKSNTYGSGLVDAHAAVTVDMGIGYAGHRLDDRQGNDDGYANPGERISLDLYMTNFENGNLDEAVSRLSIASPYVHLLDSVAELGAMAPGDTLLIENAFSFEIADNIPGHHVIEFFLTTYQKEAPDEFWSDYFTETAHAPRIELLGMEIDDSIWGNEDGYLDPGETAAISFILGNTGQLESDEISTALIPNDAYVIVLPDNQDKLPPLPSGAETTLTYMVTSPFDTPLKTYSEIKLSLLSGAHDFSVNAQLLIGQSPYYTGGVIPSTLESDVTSAVRAAQPGKMSVRIPYGAQITGVDVYYSMTSRQGAWRTDQRSYVRCISPGGEPEAAIVHGSGNSGGTDDYRREGLPIANQVEGGGEIEFELHALRNWGGEGTNSDYVYVNDNSWKTVVHYTLPAKAVIFQAKNQLGMPVAGASLSIGNMLQTTDDEGNVEFVIPPGRFYYSISAKDHRPLVLQAIEVAPVDSMLTIKMDRVFSVTFEVSDVYGNSLEDVLISLNTDTLDQGQFVAGDLESGIYTYYVSAPGHAPSEGEFEVTDSNRVLEIKLLPYYSAIFYIQNEWGGEVPDATISIGDMSLEEGVYRFDELVSGEYAYNITAEQYHDHSGIFSIESSNVQVDVLLLSDGTYMNEPFYEDFKVFPNPASGHVYLGLPEAVSAGITAMMVNSLGQTVKTWALAVSVPGPVRLEISGVPPGIYFLRVFCGNWSGTKKILIE